MIAGTLAAALLVASAAPPPIVVDRRERFVMPRDAEAAAAMSNYPDYAVVSQFAVEGRSASAAISACDHT